MDCVFVYDAKAARDAAGTWYTGSTFSQSVLNRYLGLFDRLTLTEREITVETTAGMNPVDGERISIVPLPDRLASLRDFINPATKRALRTAIIREITPDRAVIVRVPSACGSMAADYCRKNGIPYLAEVVGCPWDSLRNHSTKGKIMAPFSALRMKKTVKHAAFVVYVTDEFLQRRYPTRGRSAGISDAELQPMDASVLEKRLEKIKNHSGPWKLGTAGAIGISYKGQQFVIEALAQLKAQGCTDFEYHLAGGGDDSALRSLAEQRGVSDQVVFDGSLPHDAMFAWLDGLDIYLQPSLVEGMPRALIEAMSRALPAFGTDVGGIPELLGETALFPKGSVSRIACLLGDISPEQMENMAQKNFGRASAFEHQKLAAARTDFYREFMKACEENA